MASPPRSMRSCKQLERRRTLQTHPEHPRALAAGKRAKVVEPEREQSGVLTGDAHGLGDDLEPVGSNLTKKLECEMKTRIADPAHRPSGGSETCEDTDDFGAGGLGNRNGGEEPHQSCPGDASARRPPRR